ncbi:hypothetical protein [Mucilaginibacter sp. FT3.2]|uniref:hypothetical protein n=1 Tax=Mucilaginibacter sp. FT3.2 TaxID=2723090 RepID=UPI0016201457|nr:hypothetical protein [Mucilaginibacter sp. FT3.2]MBB6233346.1 hypothetical protein [Mucilaginibacter sp. FT3.2]
MKKTLFLLLSVLTFNIANAQFKPIAEGPVFKEPEEGFAKILQMKNGTTMFLHISNKEGIDVRVYNATHQEIVTTTVQPSYGKLSHASIEAAFEINGDAVLMISEIDSRTPVLYRVIIDAKTGAIKDDKKIGELSHVSFFQGYALAFGNVPMPDFFVRKDPNSDNYAVVMFNSFESERSKRIEIISYGADNKETGRAFYASPEEKYKYLRYIDMAVIGSDKVCVLAYGYNTKNSGGKESELILANLDKGAKAVSFTELGFSKDLTVYWGIIRYSPITKSLIFVSLVKQDTGDKGYTPILSFVNPYEKKINRTNTIAPSERLNAFSKDGFTGLPQNLFINDDGTFTIVSEEITINTYRGTMGTSVASILGDMAVVNYSKTGEFVNDYIIRKAHSVSGSSLRPFYHSYRQGSAQVLAGGNQFKSFAYLDGKTKSYILFNDTERNNDKQEEGKLVTVSGVGESDGFYYPLTGANAVPKRDYVFGNPASKHDHNLGLFSISDYDRKNNIYVTLELSKESGKKGVKVVWLQP